MVPKNLFINLFAIACSLPLLQHFVSLFCCLSECFLVSFNEANDKKQSDFEKKISTFFVLFCFLEEVERNSTGGRQEEVKIP